MENMVLTIKAIADSKGMTIPQLAEACGISVSHLYDVSSGRTKMAAEDLYLISKFAGVKMENIQFRY